MRSVLITTLVCVAIIAVPMLIALQSGQAAPLELPEKVLAGAQIVLYSTMILLPALAVATALRNASEEERRRNKRVPAPRFTSDVIEDRDVDYLLELDERDSSTDERR